MARLKTAVLISGRGSNLQALIEANERPGFEAEIVTVLSNRPEAHGLVRAKQAGIPTTLIDHHDYADRAQFDEALHHALMEAGAELVCLAGFMRILGAPFVERWPDKVINIHPSLLPAFQGLDVHERVLEAGVRVTGCTVHFVVPELDSGPIIVQAAVPVHPDDTPERLEVRVLEAEHQCYPLAVRLIAQGRVRVVGGIAHIDDARAPLTFLLNPAVEEPPR